MFPIETYPHLCVIQFKTNIFTHLYSLFLLSKDVRVEKCIFRHYIVINLKTF